LPEKVFENIFVFLNAADSFNGLEPTSLKFKKFSILKLSTGKNNK